MLCNLISKLCQAKGELGLGGGKSNFTCDPLDCLHYHSTTFDIQLRNTCLRTFTLWHTCSNTKKFTPSKKKKKLSPSVCDFLYINKMINYGVIESSFIAVYMLPTVLFKRVKNILKCKWMYTIYTLSHHGAARNMATNTAVAVQSL